jgi:hypothetical protein
MRIKRIAVVALVAMVSITPAIAASTPDEQFDGWTQLQQDNPSLATGSTLGAVFGDFGTTAGETPSYLIREDVPANSATPLCKSEVECIGHQVSMDANLDFCHDASEKNCIQDVVATTASGEKIQYTNQKYFPAAQELVFKGNPDAQAPNGSTPSVVQFPKIKNSAGTNDYAISVYVLNRFIHNSDGSGSYSDPMFLASISAVQLIKGNYTPRVAQMTSSGMDWQANYLNPECTVMEIGICGKTVSMPKDVTFSLTLRLNQTFYGWIHGRLTGGIFVSKDVGNRNYVVEISGKPSQVPFALGVVAANAAPAKLLQDTWSIQSIDRLNTFSKPIIATFAPAKGTFSYNGFLNWLPFMNNKAAAMPTVWSVRNITKDQAVASAGDQALKCLVQTAMASGNNGIAGFVNTNATSYMSGPPTYNSADQSLTYQVAAPHYTTDGSEFQGLYSLQIRADTARCIFNLTDAPVKATVSVTSSDGVEQTVSTSVNLKDDFYYFQASGFHFSAPSIKLKLVNSVAVTPTPAPSKPLAPALPVAIKCVKGKLIKKVLGANAKCPSGYKKA